jgi:hypothetical protein
MPDTVWKHKYYRVIDNDCRTPGESPLSQKLFDITGFYPNDYINSVIAEDGDLVNLISDESEFKGHFCSSLICLPYRKGPYYKEFEDRLENLTAKYNIPNIHMTDIFGKKKILGNSREEFLNEYIEIVSAIPMSCLAMSINKNKLLTDLGKSGLSNEEIYNTLFWNNVCRLSDALRNNSVIHILVEQEYDINPNNMRGVISKLFHKLRFGVDHVMQNNNKKYLSICKHPHYFTKSALLYSSLSDIAAYTCNKIQQKIDTGIPLKKITQEYRLPLKLMRSIFNNVSGVSSNALRDLIESSHDNIL